MSWQEAGLGFSILRMIQHDLSATLGFPSQPPWPCPIHTTCSCTTKDIIMNFLPTPRQIAILLKRWDMALLRNVVKMNWFDSLGPEKWSDFLNVTGNEITSIYFLLAFPTMIQLPLSIVPRSSRAPSLLGLMRYLFVFPDDSSWTAIWLNPTSVRSLL